MSTLELALCEMEYRCIIRCFSPPLGADFYWLLEVLYREMIGLLDCSLLQHHLPPEYHRCSLTCLLPPCCVHSSERLGAPCARCYKQRLM